MVIRVCCREEQVELLGVLLVHSKDEVNPFMDIVPDMLRFKLFAQDSGQIKGVGSIGWHFHLVYEELTCLVSNSLFLAKPSMEPISVLVELRHEVILWNQLCIASFSANGVIEALQAVLGSISVFTVISKYESARIWLEPLEEKDVGQE